MTYHNHKNDWTRALYYLKNRKTHSDRLGSAAPSKAPSSRPLLIQNKPRYIACNKKIDTHFRNVITDQKKRRLFEKSELKSRIYKSILMSEEWSTKPLAKRTGFRRLALIRQIYRWRIQSGGTLTRVRNRCVISGRSSTIGTTGLSRIMFRQLAGLGRIPGLLKI